MSKSRLDYIWDRVSARLTLTERDQHALSNASRAPESMTVPSEDVSITGPDASDVADILFTSGTRPSTTIERPGSVAWQRVSLFKFASDRLADFAHQLRYVEIGALRWRLRQDPAAPASSATRIARGVKE